MSGKRLLFLVLAGLLLLVGLMFYLLGAAAWRIWNIPAMSPSFPDIRNVLVSLDAVRLGYDPLVQNPFEPSAT